jgi:hypothetical protein
MMVIGGDKRSSRYRSDGLGRRNSAAPDRPTSFAWTLEKRARGQIMLKNLAVDGDNIRPGISGVSCERLLAKSRRAGKRSACARRWRRGLCGFSGMSGRSAVSSANSWHYVFRQILDHPCLGAVRVQTTAASSLRSQAAS